jgi:hypothetical protein
MDARTLCSRLALVAAFGILTACTGRTIDGPSVEQEVLAELQASGSPVTEVACPDPIDVAAGTSFTCTGVTTDGTWTIQVTQTDDQGSLSFEVVATT